MAEHAPGPWRVEDYALEDDGAWFYLDTIYDAEGHFVCHTSYTQVWGGSDKYTRANAEFIVRACNSHDELLAILELYLTQHKGASPTNTPCVCFICSSARAAIAKAKEIQEAPLA